MAIDEAGRRRPAHSPLGRDLAQRVLRHASVVGLVTGLFGLWTALTPSLVPRTWWMLMLNVAGSSLLFYLLGALIGALCRWFADVIDLRVSASPVAVRRLRWTGYLVLAAMTTWMWFWSIQQQRALTRTVGLPRGVWFVQTVGVATGLVCLAGMVMAGRAVGHGVHRLYNGVHRLIAQPILAGLVVVLALAIVLWATNNVVVRVGANAVAHEMQRINDTTAPGLAAPTSSLRSGGPGSLESWSSLGRQGQEVVANGPTAAQIEAVTGRPAQEPIRVYAGLASGRSFTQEAHGVLAELLRTGAFGRKVLVVQNGTGSGWLEEWSVAAVEYLTDGDCATASMQYSYLGSVGAFLLDRDSPRDGATALFSVIHDYWATLDPATRPKLYVSGVSLGSYGGQAAFRDAADMQAKVDGAVWAGTPGFTPIWQSLTASRRRGSPQIAPVIDNGRSIRFATSADELSHDHWGAPYATWSGPRIAYLQHASDPVVWWSPDLIWAEPDWIRERAGEDVNPAISWTPWSTFWQVTADMAVSVSTAGGHGHNYHGEFVEVWRQVLDIDREVPTQAIIDAIPRTTHER